MHSIHPLPIFLLLIPAALGIYCDLRFPMVVEKKVRRG